MAMNMVMTSALTAGLTIISRPATPNRIAASKCRKKPAQFPTMTACAISMPDARRRSHPKNTIETIVAVTERMTAAMPSTSNPMPNARNQPQCWIISGEAWTSKPWMAAVVMFDLLMHLQSRFLKRQSLNAKSAPAFLGSDSIRQNDPEARISEFLQFGGTEAAHGTPYHVNMRVTKCHLRPQ